MPKRELTENTKLTDAYTEKSVKIDKERQKGDIKKLLDENEKLKKMLEKAKAKKKLKKKNQVVQIQIHQVKTKPLKKERQLKRKVRELWII